jgi:hypothetical protein
MQKFIISVKEKTTGRDVFPPYIVNSLDGLGGSGSYVASYVNSLCAAPLLYRSCRSFRPKSRASVGFFEKGCDFMEDENPYAQIEQKIDSVVNGRVYNFNGISVRSTPPMSYIRSLLPRFSSARNDEGLIRTEDFETSKSLLNETMVLGSREELIDGKTATEPY